MAEFRSGFNKSQTTPISNSTLFEQVDWNNLNILYIDAFYKFS